MVFADSANCLKITLIALQLVIAVKAEAILSCAGSQTENQGSDCLPSSPTLDHPEVVILDQLFQHPPANPSWLICFLLGLFTALCNRLLLAADSVLFVVVIQQEWDCQSCSLVCKRWAGQLLVPMLLSQELIVTVCQAWWGGAEVGEQAWERSGAELASSEAGDLLIPRQTQCNVSCWVGSVTQRLIKTWHYLKGK